MLDLADVHPASLEAADLAKDPRLSDEELIQLTGWSVLVHKHLVRRNHLPVEAWQQIARLLTTCISVDSFRMAELPYQTYTSKTYAEEVLAAWLANKKAGKSLELIPWTKLPDYDLTDLALNPSISVELLEKIKYWLEASRPTNPALSTVKRRLNRIAAENQVETYKVGDPLI